MIVMMSSNSTRTVMHVLVSIMDDVSACNVLSGISSKGLHQISMKKYHEYSTSSTLRPPMKTTKVKGGCERFTSTSSARACREQNIVCTRSEIHHSHPPPRESR